MSVWELTHLGCLVRLLVRKARHLMMMIEALWYSLRPHWLFEVWLLFVEVTALDGFKYSFKRRASSLVPEVLSRTTRREVRGEESVEILDEYQEVSIRLAADIASPESSEIFGFSNFWRDSSVKPSLVPTSFQRFSIARPWDNSVRRWSGIDFWGTSVMNKGGSQ